MHSFSSAVPNNTTARSFRCRLQQYSDSDMTVAGDDGSHGTKKAGVIRYLQLATRIVKGVGAIGVLVCMVFIEDVEAPASWISKVAVSGASLMNILVSNVCL